MVDQLYRQSARMVYAISRAVFGRSPDLSRKKREIARGGAGGTARQRASAFGRAAKADHGKTSRPGHNAKRSGRLVRGQFYKTFAARTELAFKGIHEQR